MKKKMIRFFLFDSGLQHPLSKSPVKTPVLLILQSGMDSTAFFVSLMRSSSKLCSQPRCYFIFYLFQRQLQNALIVQPQVSETINQTEHHRNTKITFLRLKRSVQCTVYIVHPLSFGLRYIMMVLISRCYSSAVQEVLLPLLLRTAKSSQLQHDFSSQTQNCQQHCVQSLQPN